MALRDILKNAIKRGINIPQWVGYRQWQQMSRVLLKLVKPKWGVTSLTQPKKEETSFEHIVQRFQLSEADLIQRQKQFQRLMRLWLSLCALALMYGFYLAIHRAWLGVISMLGISMMMLCQAFQYHFWLFQIRQRRLDCTLEEWWWFTCRK